MSHHKYIYIAVRTDLEIAQQAVQSSHALLEMTRTCIPDLSSHPSIIILGVKTEEKLKNLITKLVKHGKIPFASFREPDRNNEYTALATIPIYGKDRDFFRNYQLMKGV